jgi:hypothetical protein
MKRIAFTVSCLAVVSVMLLLGVPPQFAKAAGASCVSYPESKTQTGPWSNPCGVSNQGRSATSTRGVASYSRTCYKGGNCGGCTSWKFTGGRTESRTVTCPSIARQAPSSQQ